MRVFYFKGFKLGIESVKALHSHAIIKKYPVVHTDS